MHWRLLFNTQRHLWKLAITYHLEITESDRFASLETVNQLSTRVYIKQTNCKNTSRRWCGGSLSHFNTYRGSQRTPTIRLWNVIHAYNDANRQIVFAFSPSSDATRTFKRKSTSRARLEFRVLGHGAMLCYTYMLCLYNFMLLSWEWNVKLPTTVTHCGTIVSAAFWRSSPLRDTNAASMIA